MVPINQGWGVNGSLSRAFIKKNCMQRYLFICLLFLASSKSFGQLDDATINKLAVGISENFKKDSSSNDGFSPIKMLYANYHFFRAGNNPGYLTIRKLLLSKAFPNNQAIFKWLAPKVNKVFMQQYSETRNPLLIQYRTLYQQLSKGFCPCISIAAKSKDVSADNDFNTCLQQYITDTSLMRQHVQTYLSLGEKDQVAYLLGGMLYAQVNCETVFNKSMALVRTDLSKMVDESIENYKRGLLENTVTYMLKSHLDSLKEIFPTFAASKTILQQIGELYKDNHNIHYNLDVVFETSGFQRISSYMIIITPNKQVKLLGQAVYEIMLDKPLYYLRNLKFYPRDKMQGIEKLEADIRKSIPDEYFN